MILELKLTNDWIEATWYEEVDEGINRTKQQIHCESFSGHPEHIAMLRAKALEFSTETTVQDESMITECITNFKHPTEGELAQQAIDNKISEAKAYLASTDFKMTIDYDEDVTDIKAKRAEARDFIRANS